MKKLVASLGLALVLAATPVQASSITPDAVMFLNQTSITTKYGSVQMDVRPVNVDGTVIVPVRSMMEVLGARVDWFSNTRQVRISDDNATILLTVGSTRAFVNGREVFMRRPAQIINERVFIPLRFVSENLGHYVDWNSNLSKISIFRDTLSDTTRPQPVLHWPSVTHVVQTGETPFTVAQRYNTTVAKVLEYNYMTTNDHFNTGQKVAINGYAPRNYAVIPGEDSAPARTGKLVDWYLDGQYLLKRGDNFTIVDVATGKQFQVTMMGGVEHSDIEPLTQQDTQVMLSLFGSWTWSPRPVVIWKDGMNIAGSLSGMPHSFDTVPGNGVTGHFDLYLYNSQPHGTGVSAHYVNQHANAVQIAAGRK